MKKLIIGTLIFPFLACAQDDPKPVSIGGFDNTGSATFGYRFTDVKGYEPKYEQLFDLNSGPRLLDFSLFGKAQEGQNRFADDYSLTLSGFGGDPFSSAQLTVSKKNIYELHADFRQSYYYWNLNDSAVLPITAGTTGSDGLTNNHNWATVRKMGSMNFLVHATNNLKFSFEYYRNTREGVTDTTRSLDYFGSSSTWGSFARADPYYVIAPFNEAANRVTAGIDYTVHDWNFHYRIGYQSFTDGINGSNAISGEQSLNIDDPTTAKELLNGLSWFDSRKLTTPVSEFSYTSKLTSRLEMRGGYIFYRYSGSASLNLSQDGTARTNSGGTTDAPYAISLTSTAQVTEPNNVIDQGFTYKVNDWWDLLLDYRYSRFTVDSDAQFRSVNGATIVSGVSSDQWRIGTSTLDFNTAFTPTANLLVRVGVRLMKSDVEAIQDSVVDPTRTKRIKTVWPIGSIYYQPWKMLTVRADVEDTVNGTSYTALTPHFDIGGRFVVRVRPTEKLYIEDTAIFRNRTLLQTDYHSTIRSNGVTVNYDVLPQVTVYAGLNYDSFFAEDFVNFLRGPAPITDISLRDQTVERIWQGGIRAEPLKGLGINFTGNYLRTTGVGQLTGEAPLYGPMTFPYATGSIYYDFPRAGRLTAQLQRTYYTEQIVPGNNFSAKILTLAFTRSF